MFIKLKIDSNTKIILPTKDISCISNANSNKTKVELHYGISYFVENTVDEIHEMLKEEK